MKKLIEKLLKNETFKKIGMGVTFVLMCCFACFMNWQAVVGAEGEGGGTRASNTATINISDFTNKVISTAAEPGRGVTYLNNDSGEGDYLATNYVNVNTRTLTIDTEKDLYVKVRFREDVMPVSDGGAALVYMSSTGENIRGFLYAFEEHPNTNTSPTCYRSITWKFAKNTIDGSAPYNFKLVPPDQSLNATIHWNESSYWADAPNVNKVSLQNVEDPGSGEPGHYIYDEDRDGSKTEGDFYFNRKTDLVFTLHYSRESERRSPPKIFYKDKTNCTRNLDIEKSSVSKYDGTNFCQSVTYLIPADTVEAITEGGVKYDFYVLEKTYHVNIYETLERDLRIPDQEGLQSSNTFDVLDIKCHTGNGDNNDFNGTFSKEHKTAIFDREGHLTLDITAKDGRDIGTLQYAAAWEDWHDWDSSDNPYAPNTSVTGNNYSYYDTIYFKGVSDIFEVGSHDPNYNAHDDMIIKYTFPANGDMGYCEMPTVEKDGKTIYAPLVGVPKGTNLRIQIINRHNEQDTTTNLAFYTVENLYFEGGLTKGIVRGDPDETHPLINFSKTQDSTLFLDPPVEVSVSLDGDNDGTALYKQIDLLYNGYIDYDDRYDPFPSDGAEGSKKYKTLTDGAFYGQKFYINASAKPGADLSGLQYKLNNGSVASWQNGGVKEFTLTDASNTITFSQTQFKKVNLKFLDENNNALRSDLVSIYYDGSEHPLENNTKQIDGISKTEFMIKLEYGCSNASLSLSENFDISGKATGEKAELSEGDSGGWNPDNRQFTLTVDIQSSQENLTIHVKGLESKAIKFNFDMLGNYKHSLNVGVPSEGSVVPDGYSRLTSDKQTTDNATCQYSGTFAFYLKTEDYAYWKEDYSGSESNPDASSEILKLLRFDGGAVDDITSEYISSSDIYKITLTKVRLSSGNGDGEINIHFNDATDTNNINISFTSVNLPDGNNGIKANLGGNEFGSADRGASPYTLKLTLKPEGLNGDGVPLIYDTTKIKLENLDNFELVRQDYSDFKLKDWTFDGSISADKSEISFNLNSKIAAAVKALKSGDLNIECRCLMPKNKKVTIEDIGFESTSTKIQDERGNSYVIDEDNNERVCMVPYGSRITITDTLKDGYFMDDPEEQFRAYKIKNDGQLEEITNWEINKDNKTCKVSFDNILIYDLKAEFIADKNNIPMVFKDIEGISYYYANMDDSSGKNTLVVNDPFEKEDGNKKQLKGIKTINAGNDYYFAVGAQAGYDIGNIVIKSNGKKLEECAEVAEDKKENCKFYKLENVDSSITVSGSINKKTLKVNFNTNIKDENDLKLTYKSDNANVTSLNVTYGNSVTFKVGLPEKYSQSNFKVYVRAQGSNEKGQELTEYQNEYKILDITEDKEVYATDVVVNKYVVNFVSSNRAEYLLEGSTFQGTKENINYGSAIEFKVKAKKGYKLDKDTIVNCQMASGDTELAKSKDSVEDESTVYKCRLTNIRENCTITVDNVDNITYKVMLKDVPGVTYLNDKNSVVSGGMKVKYGKNFEFSVNVDDAYDDSAAGMFIVLNDGKSKLSAQKLSSGRYMIPNITEDVAIKVGNIRKNTYTVTLRNEEGIDYYNSNNKVINGDNTVDHGSSFSFRVSLYPAYSDSSISVMLGNDKLTPNEDGYYKIDGIVEDKMVTVTGIHPNSEVGLINAINNLPSSVNDLNDVNPVVEASRWYNSLTDEQKANVTNADVLMNLQQQAGALLHNIDGVSIDGVDWYIKLVVVPISSDMDACTRIYKKLSSEYILSLYDIYLWDVLNDVKYTSYGDQMYTITVPAPKLANFRNPTGVHEDSSSGKVSFMDLMFSGDRVSFQTNSFSAMGIIASHDASGVSSLFDAADANLAWIKGYVPGGARSGASGRDGSGNVLLNDDDATNDDAGANGNIHDKFRSMNNRVTPQGSALRLILVLLILALLALALWTIYKRHKEKKDDSTSSEK